MGNSQTSSIKIGYEDIQYVLKSPSDYLLINTLSSSEQGCLIKNTISMSNEESIVNNCIQTKRTHIHIVVYGKNSNDESVHAKYSQFYSLGFYNVYIYSGGLFEWLLLQDIYGEHEFPTSSKELDMLKYKPSKRLNVPLIEY